MNDEMNFTAFPIKHFEYLMVLYGKYIICHNNNMFRTNEHNVTKCKRLFFFLSFVFVQQERYAEKLIGVQNVIPLILTIRNAVVIWQCSVSIQHLE